MQSIAGYDYVLVGGGLQNSLIALLLSTYQPQCRVLLLEQEATFGGNHTWCFHKLDVPVHLAANIAPLVCARWPRYRVRFPASERVLETSYAAISSTNLHASMLELARKWSGLDARLNVKVESVTTTAVRLSDGTNIAGRLVIDARGPSVEERGRGGVAYQKFLGLELEVGCDLTGQVPTLMDACVSQAQGFHFMYSLPFDGSRILLEDTYFSESPELCVDTSRNDILRYAHEHGLQPKRIIREERGCLPLPYRSALRLSEQSPLRAGYGGGWFNPATGYSFPVALRLADFVARRAPEQTFGDEFRSFSNTHARSFAFSVLLNKLLFGGFEPQHQLVPFERFYRLPLETIERFYAGELTGRDKFRIFWGLPPRGFSALRLISNLKEESLRDAIH